MNGEDFNTVQISFFFSQHRVHLPISFPCPQKGNDIYITSVMGIVPPPPSGVNAQQSVILVRVKRGRAHLSGEKEKEQKKQKEKKTPDQNA